MNDKLKKFFFDSMDKEYPKFNFSSCKFTIQYRMQYSALSIGTFIVNVYDDFIPIDEYQDQSPTFVIQINFRHNKNGIYFELVESSDSHSIFLSKIFSLDWVDTMNLLEEWFSIKNINYVFDRLKLEVNSLVDMESKHKVTPRLYFKEINFS